MGQFIHPFSFSIIQPFLQPRSYNLIGGLGLSIPLRISRRRILVPNSQLPTISLEGFTVKLKTIIRDQSVRNSKRGDNIPPDEPLSVHVPDISKGLSFHLLGKVVHADEEPSSVSCSLRKWPHYIQALLSKRPRAR